MACPLRLIGRFTLRRSMLSSREWLADWYRLHARPEPSAPASALRLALVGAACPRAGAPELWAPIAKGSLAGMCSALMSILSNSTEPTSAKAGHTHARPAAPLCGDKALEGADRQRLACVPIGRTVLPACHDDQYSI